MSRTYRMSREYEPRTAPQQRSLGCPGGRGCRVCRDNRRASNVRREQAAVAAIAAWYADPEPMFPVVEPEWDECRCCCCTGGC